MKLSKLTCGILIIICLAFAVTAFASDEQAEEWFSRNKGSYQFGIALINNSAGESADLYYEPNNPDSLMGKYLNGTRVILYDWDGDMSGVKILDRDEGSVSGYIKTEYLAFGEEMPAIVSHILLAKVSPPNNENVANIHLRPNDQTDVLHTLTKNTTINIVGVYPGWYHIECLTSEAWVRGFIQSDEVFLLDGHAEVSTDDIERAKRNPDLHPSR